MKKETRFSGVVRVCLSCDYAVDTSTRQGHYDFLEYCESGPVADSPTCVMGVSTRWVTIHVGCGGQMVGVARYDVKEGVYKPLTTSKELVQLKKKALAPTR